MTGNIFIRIRNFVILALVQVLVFSQIHLFGYATACVYLIFLLKLPRHTNRNELLIWGFLFGIVVDIFSNTPGVNAAAATAMCFVRNALLSQFIPKSVPDDFVPGAKTLKWGSYLLYAASCMVIFYSVLFLIELFTLNQHFVLLAGVFASTLLTMLFVIVAELFSRPN